MNDTPVSATQSKATSPNTEPVFVCDCGEWARSACQGEPFFREHEGKRYCVLHYPDKDKIEEFRVAMNKKLGEQGFDFKGVYFPEEIDFRNFQFDSDADFIGATFSANTDFFGATFGANSDFNGANFSANADFTSATFSAFASFLGTTFRANVHFRGVTFGAYTSFTNAIFSANVYFDNSTFNANVTFWKAAFNALAVFLSATFNGNIDFKETIFRAQAIFGNATFNANADFSQVTFNAKADFLRATFKNYIMFTTSMNEKKSLGKEPQLDFQFAHIDKSERVSFHTYSLKPHWFINVDCRKFEFIDCEWGFDLKEEMDNTSKAEISAPHRLLAIAYRQLADNAEANHRYQEASKFRYNAFEARRIERFWGFVPWRLDWWYWLASGYGERVGRAFIVFIALFALFAFGYGRVGFEQGSKTATPPAAVQTDTVGKPLDWKDAFLYGIGVSILQKPDPKPLTRAAKTLVYLQTVLGPAQGALLALAVRRRFMR